jgi:hypothetical protein
MGTDLIEVNESQNLPALVEGAANRLASAKTYAEVLDACNEASVVYDMAKKAARIARTKQADDDLISVIHRTQASALQIEAMAKLRLADEYDAAQERGEIRTQADNQAFSRAEKAGFEDLARCLRKTSTKLALCDAEQNDQASSDAHWRSYSTQAMSRLRCAKLWWRRETASSLSLSSFS